MKAGLILTTQFETPNNKVCSGFIDYIDRPMAATSRGEAGTFGNYQNYMSNPEKSTGLFNETKNHLSESEKETISNAFDIAAKKGANLHKTVISFDSEWLIKTGLLTKDLILNETKIKEYTRTTVATLQKQEGMEDSIWTAAIHHNTEHYHIHIAMIEPEPSWKYGYGRCRVDCKGELYQRGKFKNKSLERAKSTFINQALNLSDRNKDISELMRNRIIQQSKIKTLKNNNTSKLLRKLCKNLPDDINTWNYGNKAMQKYRVTIDALSNSILYDYFQTEMQEIKALLQDVSDLYTEAYGKRQTSFYRAKMDDLFYRFGNAILTECRNIEKKRRSNKTELVIKKKYYGRGITSSINAIKRNFYKDIEHLKNQHLYEELQERINNGYY